MDTTVPGFSATSLAWIPLRRRSADLHGFGGWIRRHALLKPVRYAAIKLLFGTGNDPVPDDVWGDAEAFRQYLDSQEYRGALMLEEVTLHVDAGGRATDIVARRLPDAKHWGFTPIGIYWSGNGKVRTRKYCRDGTGFIDYRVYFRVGWLANLGALLLTFRFAPYAWMRLRYQLSADQAHAGEADGSYIPTQRHVIGALSYLHPIESCDDKAVARFMAAGNAVPAPRRGFARLQ